MLLNKMFDCVCWKEFDRKVVEYLEKDTCFSKGWTKLNSIYNNHIIFWTTCLVLGPGVGVSLYFVPNSEDEDELDDEDNQVYRGDLLLFFTLWYVMCNIVTCISIYINFPSQRFGTSLIISGFINGGLEHFDVYINDYSLYTRNIIIYGHYLFYMGIIVGTYPGFLTVVPLLIINNTTPIIVIILVLFLLWASGWFITMSYIDVRPFGPNIEWHHEHMVLHTTCMVIMLVVWIYYWYKKHNNKNQKTNEQTSIEITTTQAPKQDKDNKDDHDNNNSTNNNTDEIESNKQNQDN